MSEEHKKSGLLPIVIIIAGVLIAVVVWAIVKHQPAEQINTTPVVHEHQPIIENIVQETKTETKIPISPTLSLSDVIRSAQTWGPAYNSWRGREAADFTLTDIAGKRHKLSDFRGKDVMLVFWATWCSPCIMEVPHLIALQNIIGKEKLAILAISHISPNSTTEMVKNFVKQNQRINYTVFSVDAETMPAPFNYITVIPCSFFIDKQGKIKLATEGLLSLGDMKGILLAESAVK